MSTTFIATNSISTTLRISSMKSRAALSEATKEATTGRLADVGKSLGALAGRDVVLRAELVDIEKLVDTNALVAGHMDVAQQRVGVLIDTAEAFQKDLLAARNSANGGGIIAQPASANLQSLIATLNVTMDGHICSAASIRAWRRSRTMRRGRPARRPSTLRLSQRSGSHRIHRWPLASPPPPCRISSIRHFRRSSTILPGERTGRRLPTR